MSRKRKYAIRQMCICIVFMVLILISFIGLHPTYAQENVVMDLAGLTQAIAQAPDNVQTTIQIGQDITVNSAIIISANKDILLNGDKRLIRGTSLTTNAIILVEPDGQLVIDGITLDGANISASNAALHVQGYAELRSGIIKNNHNTVYGGGVRVQGANSSQEKATFAMTGGHVQDNQLQFGDHWGRGSGAGVFVMNGRFHMTGGEIHDNVSTRYLGGGVGIVYDAEFILDSGSIHNNEAARHGGGICVGVPELVGDWVTPGGPNWVELISGEIYENEAYNYIDNAYGLGGGVYIQDETAHVTIANAVIKNNAVRRAGTANGGEGGGVWYCPKGLGSHTKFSNAAIFDNTATDKGADLYKENTSEMQNNKVTLTGTLPNGGTVKWYKDDAPRFTTEETGTLLPIDTAIDNTFGAISVISDQDKQAADQSAKLKIYDNKSGVGGGIAINSPVNFGYDAGVKTSVSEKGTGKKVLLAEGSVTLVDKIEYEGLLTDGTQYRIEATLMNRANSLPIEIDGQQITYSENFTVIQANGVKEVELFIPDASSLAGKELVVYQRLIYANSPILSAAHLDIDDADQRVTFEEPVDPPISITTSASDGQSKDKAGKIRSNAVIEDVVTYTNLTPQTEYRLEGILMNRDTGQPIEIGTEQIKKTHPFTPTSANGSELVEFSFDATSLPDGIRIVVFQELYLDNVLVAEHKILESDAQTVKFIGEPEPSPSPSVSQPPSATESSSPSVSVPVTLPSSRTPGTGDSSELTVWLAIGAMAIVVGATVILIRKAKKSRK